jgi:hypothetical protein
MDQKLLPLCRRVIIALLLVLACGPGGLARAGEEAVSAAMGRVEVVLANQYRTRESEIRAEFAEVGLKNVHFQYARMGQPPQNLGLGRDVPADKAREVIRLAIKYNGAVTILLPDRLFPARFATIASSNYDDTVEYHIDEATLAKLRNPELSTEAFHTLYREITSVPLEPKGRNLGRPY